MRFQSPWQFTLGSQLAVALRGADEKGAPSLVKIEGLVVECEQIVPHCFRVTVLFLDELEDGQADPALTHSNQRAGSAI